MKTTSPKPCTGILITDSLSIHLHVLKKAKLKQNKEDEKKQTYSHMHTPTHTNTHIYILKTEILAFCKIMEQFAGKQTNYNKKKKKEMEKATNVIE